MPYGLPLIYNENKSGPAGDKSRTGQCGITLWRRCRQPQLAQPQSCFLAQFFFSLTFFQSHFSFVSNNFVHRCRQPHLAQPPLFLGPHFFSPSFLFIPVYLLFPISFSPRCRQRQPPLFLGPHLYLLFPGVSSNSRHNQRSLRTWLQVQVRPIFIVGRKSFQIGFW